MNILTPEENMKQVLLDFDEELLFLQNQQVLTKLDAHKIKNQAEISKNAMLYAKHESSFTDQAKAKLLNALIRDFEKSLQRTLDDAVRRKGDDKALLVYKLNRVDKKLQREMISSGMLPDQMGKIGAGIEFLKLFMFRSLPEKNNSFWNSSKIDIESLVKNYELTVLDYIQHHFNHLKFLR